MEEIKIDLSKRKLVLLLSAGIGFVFISCWFIVNPSSFVNFSTRNEIFVFITGILGVVIFGVASVFLFIKLFGNKSGLVINKQGIIDNTNSSSVGLISWSEITKIYKKKVISTEILIIEIKNPEEYIQKANGLKKLGLRQNLKSYGTPITLTSVGLKCSFNELERLILESYNQNKQMKN
ncbi:MAG: STM3941 family protein [Flavobacterium sp.]